jgi:predicted alpha/beta hydrolase
MAKFNHTPIKNDLMVNEEEIYIFPIAEPVYNFLEKVWSSFVNKMVALTFPNQEHIFDHSVFEVIQGSEIRIVASATHFKMKEIIGQKKNKDIQDFINKTKPIPLNDEKNESARIIQRAIMAYSYMRRPEVEFVELRRYANLHPHLKMLLTETMRYAVGIPLIVKDSPIGILWGIRRKMLTEEQKKDIISQLHTLFDVIEYVVGLEVDRKGDEYFAKKNIEKADTTSTIHHLLYTIQPGQKDPVTSIIAHSHIYNMMYRLDASYIVPTTNGYSVSIKHFAPEQMNHSNTIILTIPGFFCRRSIMDKVSREMALRYGYRVFSMDMRGRSRYTLPRYGKKYSWTLDDYIYDDFPAVIQWIHNNFPGQDIVVMGHSMGGMIPRFYAAAYEKIRKMEGKQHRIDPNKYIRGIVSITSPNYMDLESNILGLSFVKNGVRMIPSKAVYDLLFNLVSFPVKNTLSTIDLNSFFKFVLNLHSSLRQFSFQVSTTIVNLNDFVGYKQISPAEWYFLVEDVFCEESVKVILQFVRSQISHENGFYSYDGNINYTAEMKNLKIPVFSVVGTVDKIVPPATVEGMISYQNIPNQKISYYEQGHLGIVFHQETVSKMCAEAHEWIQSLKPVASGIGVSNAPADHFAIHI